MMSVPVKCPAISFKILYKALKLLTNPQYLGISLVTSFVIALSPTGYLGLLGLVYIGLKQEPSAEEEVRQRFKRAVLGQYLPFVVLWLWQSTTGFMPQGYPVGVSGVIHALSVCLTYLVCLQANTMKSQFAGIWGSSIGFAKTVSEVALSMPIASIVNIGLVICISIACDFAIHFVVLLTATDVNNYKLLWALIICLKVIPITFVVSYGVAIITNELNKQNRGDIDRCH